MFEPEEERPSGVRRAEAGLIEAVAVGAELLLRSPHSAAAMSALIEQLGRAAKASRAYLFMIRTEADDVVADETIEWTAEGIAPQIGKRELRGWSFERTGNHWLLEKLRADEIVAGPAAEMPAPFRTLLVEPGVASLILVPIRIGGSWRGFIGFDDCWRPRRWSEAESVALRIGASLLGAAMEREESESALRASEERLRQAARMESWGRFAAGLARDFDGLMSSIRSYGERLVARLGPADPMRADLAEILLAGERAAELTRDLLAFGRQQPARIEAFDPMELLAERLPLLRRIVGDGVGVTQRVGPAVGRVIADPGLVEQALVTLCLDAREALGESGRIDFSLARAAAGELEGRGAGSQESAEYVRLSMRDDRPALDRESAARLFEPFFSTEELGRGRGLGLSTVYGAIRQCGGYVFVDSDAENGTVFDLYLPAEPVARPMDVASPPVAAATAPAASGTPAGPTILLVEDEDLIRSLAEQILVERGYTILAAANASEAIDLAARSNTTIDLLLTDIVMPGASGSDLAQRLLRSFPEMRVLYMSGYSDSLIFRYGVLQERAAFLQKPFSADVLERKVRDLPAEPTILRRHQAQRARPARDLRRRHRAPERLAAIDFGPKAGIISTNRTDFVLFLPGRPPAGSSGPRPRAGDLGESTMLRMTKQADYGFVLLSRLAADPERVVNAPDLAAETRLPVPTVSKILKLLAKGGVLRSSRGVHGGYSLARGPGEISAAELLTALEGPVALTVCIDGTPGECDHETYCQVRGHWQRINQALEEALGRITLAELSGGRSAGAPDAGGQFVQIGRGRLAAGATEAPKPSQLSS